MANKTLILAAEASVASGIGNSTTVGSATCVRVFNSSGSDLQITVTDPTGANEYSGTGSITLPDNQVEFIEKQPSFTIHGNGAFKATKVGFTN
tara:strand:+ start:196 stop:474 length:279 start_codon:yes stop_codon:yes gene_type:complete